MANTPVRWIAFALAGVLVSLLLVGVVSRTPLRHIVQVTPIAIAWLAVARKLPWASYAAPAVLLFWLIIMTLIWLYLLDLAKIVTGTFSPVETALTVCVGISCIVGFVAWWRVPAAAKWPARLAAFAAFFLLQIGAMWLSLRPAIEHR